MNNAGLSQAQSDPLLPKKGDPDQQHPGSLFPAPTIAYPPSPTASSPSVRGNDDFGHSTNANIGFGEQMEGDGAREHRRRRSSLINGVASGNGQPRHQPRRTDEDTINEESKRHSSDDDDSDFSSHDTTEDVQLDDILAEEGLEDDEETGLTGNERKKRRSRKKRKMDLDERVAGELRLKKDMRKEADLSIIRQSLINGVLIGLWYIFSLSISLYNKWMFSKDHLHFNFPLFTTSLHMLVQFTLASLVLYLFPRFRPRHDSIANPDIADSVPAESEKPLMTRFFYLTRLGPCGAATGLDIGLGNMSLRFISLTFYTMCKSSSLAFVLTFAFLFHLESPSVKLILIILTMTIGVIMMVAGETAFNILGFLLVISAAFFSGFRWALTQILLLRNPATSNPFSSIFFLAPIMFASLLAIALPVEGPGPLAVGFGELMASKGRFTAVALVLFPGCLAFMMTASEFALLQRTSVVTLSICGIFKEVVTISAASLVFHDELTLINVSGLVVTIASIAAYNYIKIKKMRVDAQEEVRHEYATVDASEAQESSELFARTSGDGELDRAFEFPPTVGEPTQAR